MKRGLKRDHLQLEDGRTLSYIVDGDASSHQPIIFYFHGMLGKGSDFITKAPPTSHIAIYLDRPGYGESSGAPSVSSWTYGDFAHDVEQLANHLSFDKFYVLGHSSGGPCALACGGHLGERVIGICAIAGDPEYRAEGAPKEWCMACDILSILFLIPICFLILSLGGLCGPFARRTMGVFSDYRVERKKYDFSVEDIAQPTLFATGDIDTTVPPSDTKFTHERVPGSELLIIDGAGHLTILSHKHMKTIVEKLLSMEANGSNKSVL